MTNWIVTLSGDETDLQELVKVWNQPDLTIEKENDTYIMKSSHFTALTKDQDVREKANELLIPINAGIKLTLGAFKPIEIAHTTQIMPDGTKMGYVMGYAVVGVRAFASVVLTKKDGTAVIENPADPVVSLYNLAQSDSQVAKMCQYINLDLNSWFTLYNRHSAGRLSKIIIFIRPPKQCKYFPQIIRQIGNFDHPVTIQDNRVLSYPPEQEKDPFQGRTLRLFFRLADHGLPGAFQFPPEPEFRHRVDEQTEYHDHSQSLDPGILFQEDLRYPERFILQEPESPFNNSLSLVILQKGISR